jgi:hypothetical protein
MTDTNTGTPEAAPEGMTLDLRSNPSVLTLPDYSIPAEHQHIAAGITAKHYLYDVPGPVTATSDVKLPDRLSVTMLPPEHAAPIIEALKAAHPSARDQVEQELVGKAVEEIAFQLRVNAGIADSNDAFTKAKYEVHRRQFSLSNEAASIVSDMAAIAHTEVIYDEHGVKTGERHTPKLEGDALLRASARLREVDAALKALEIEGPLQLDKARHQATMAEVERRQLFADHAEIERLSDEIVRDDRINDAARKRAAMKRNTL